MTTITSDTSVMPMLEKGASAQYFSLLEESNELSKEQNDRQEKVAKEMASMSSNAGQYRDEIKESFKNATTKLKDGIANPLIKMREESITAYTNFTESIGDMSTNMSNKLSSVKTGFTDGMENLKTGFSTKVDNLKTGFTDAVGATKDVMESMSIKMEAFKNLPTEQKLLLGAKTIADTVGAGITTVANFTKSSSGYLKKLFQKSEESEDVGGTSGLSDSGKDKEDSKPDGSLGGLFGGIGGMIKKIMPKGLMKILGNAGKMLGKVGRLAGKLALPLVAIMSIFDFVGGIKNAEEIVGKPADQLSTMEKAGAGLAGVVSGLTLGFIDAKTIYSEGAQMLDSVSGFASEMFAKLPDGVQGGLKKVTDILFSSETGIFGSIGRIFSQSIEAISQGNWGDLLLNVITTPLQLLFSADGMLATSFNHMVDGATALFELLPNSFQENITGLVDTLMGFFDKIKNFATDLIPDSIKGLFGDAVSSDVGKKGIEMANKGIDSVKGFFGWGGDEEEAKADTKPVKAKRTFEQVKPVEVTAQGGGNPALEAKLAENRAIIAQRKNEPSSSTVVSKTVEGDAKDNPELQQKIQERRKRLEAFKKRRQSSGKSDGVSMEAIAKGIKDSDTATKKSKAKMNEKKEAQPVIIQQPAPAQKSSGSGKQLNTSTSIGDTELAVMNSNMMD